MVFSQITKNINSQVKIRDFHEVEKKNSIGNSDFGYENRKKHPIYVSKKCFEEKHVDLLLTEEKEEAMFLSKISIHSCIIILYIVGKKIFVDIFLKFLVQKKC